MGCRERLVVYGMLCLYKLGSVYSQKALGKVWPSYNKDTAFSEPLSRGATITGEDNRQSPTKHHRPSTHRHMCF